MLKTETVKSRLLFVVAGISIAAVIAISYQLYVDATTNVIVYVARSSPTALQSLDIQPITVSVPIVEGNTKLQQLFIKADESLDNYFGSGYSSEVSLDEAKILLTIVSSTETTKITNGVKSYTTLIEYNDNYYVLRLTSDRL